MYQIFGLFDVEFGYIIHFKTVEVQFDATFGEYQIPVQVLIYRYFSKILEVILSFKRFKLFSQNISVEWGCSSLLKKITTYYFKSFFHVGNLFSVRMQYRINQSMAE